MNLRGPLFLVGILLAVLALAMGLPVSVDLLDGHDNWRAFAGASVASLFVGGALVMTNWGYSGDLRPRQAVVFIALAWLTIAAFGAIPFLLSDFPLRPVDAIFESVSGITTTGATVIETLSYQSRGLLLWRALLQWVGGIGFILMAASVLPALQVGGMQLFRLESSDRSEKIMPRANQMIKRIGLVYIVLTVICAIGYRAAGMGIFEGFAHALTTVSTGGYSTRDGSIAEFANPAIEWWGSAFMVLGALPFVLYARAVSNGPQILVLDSQVRSMLLILVAAIALCTVMLWQQETVGMSALRLATFNVVSVMTGTGYASAAYDGWGTFALPLFCFLMLLGGCAGSTTCGIKIFRLQVMFATLVSQLVRVGNPRLVSVPVFNGRPITDDVIASVMGFFFLFMGSLALVSLGLGLMGLDLITSLSAAAAALANVGPGLGPVVGPSGTYALLPDGAKWLLSLAMMLGRLEFLTLLALLTRRFWSP